MADDAAARAYIQEAATLIANQDYDRAHAKLELADVELEDLTGDTKAAVAALIKETQASITTAKSSQHRPRYLRALDNLLSEAESDIGNLATWPTSERKIAELYADANAQSSIADELAAAQSKFNTFRKLHTRKATAAIAQQITSDVESAESQWADTKEMFEEDPESTNSYAVDKTRRYVDDARKRLATLPSDNEIGMQLSARLDIIMAELTDIALSSQASEMVAQLERQFTLYENEWGGWEEETDAPPSWDDFRRNKTNAMAAFGAPRTRIFRERIQDFIDNLANDTNYQEVAGSASVKAVIDDILTQFARAKSSLLARIETLLPTALTANVQDAYDYERLERDIGRTLGEDSPSATPLMAKVRTKLTAHEQGVAYAEQAGADQIDALFAKAEEVWPTLYAGLSWAEEINLSEAGQTIGFLADNLVGYRFTPGTYYYATTIGGTPVAMTIDAQTMAGIKNIEALLGRALGDDDRDGKWDVIATVTDRKTTLQARKQAESSGTIGGLDVSMSHDYTEPVEAVVIEMLAAKCGPFAGAKGRGVLKTDGTVGT